MEVHINSTTLFSAFNREIIYILIILSDEPRTLLWISLQSISRTRRVNEMNLVKIAVLIGLVLESMARPIPLCSNELTMRHPRCEEYTHHYTVYPEQTTKSSVVPPSRNPGRVPTTKPLPDVITASIGVHSARSKPYISVIRHVGV